MRVSVKRACFSLAIARITVPIYPKCKVMQAVLDPLGMPLATDVVAGNRADDPLYVPCIERVQASLGAAACCMWATARWRRERRELGLQARGLITCVRCLRCNWLRENSKRLWKPLSEAGGSEPGVSRKRRRQARADCPRL